MHNVLENAMVKSAGAAVTMFSTMVYKKFSKVFNVFFHSVREPILKPVHSYEEWNQTNLAMLNKIYCEECFSQV